MLASFISRLSTHLVVRNRACSWAWPYFGLWLWVGHPHIFLFYYNVFLGVCGCVSASPSQFYSLECSWVEFSFMELRSCDALRYRNTQCKGSSFSLCSLFSPLCAIVQSHTFHCALLTHHAYTWDNLRDPWLFRFCFLVCNPQIIDVIPSWKRFNKEILQQPQMSNRRLVSTLVHSIEKLPFHDASLHVK